MKKVVYTPDLSREEWLEYRKKGIGGSDAAAIAGLNPWKSAVGVYLDKKGEVKLLEDNERMRIGRDLEDYVAKRFEEATGLKVRRNNFMLAHHEHDFLVANIDREIVGKQIGLECKTTNSYAKKDWEEDIPTHYEIQCHHYMMVTGYQGWYIAVLIGNEKFEYKYIPRDEEIIKYLKKIEVEFWKNNVLADNPPAPDGSDDADMIIRNKFPKATLDVEIELQEFKGDIDRLDTIKSLQDELKTEEKEIKQKIQMQMGEAEKAVCGDRVITWKNYSSSRIDTKKLKEIYPDIAEDLTRTTNSRRFLIK